MFIRKDLEEAIKNRFGVEKFVYTGIEKNSFNDRSLLMFDAGKEMIGIELGNCYYIYELPKNPGSFFKIKAEFNYLYASQEQTYLRVNGVVMNFWGKAFDFTEESVIAALEKGGN